MNGRIRWLGFAVVLLLFIVVPFLLWEESLNRWSERLLQSSNRTVVLAPLVVVLLTVDVVLPIPSSFVAAAAPALLGPLLGALSVWLGLSASAWFGYGVGRLGGEPLAAGIAGKEELARAGAAMEQHGPVVLLLCRGVPVLAEASTLFAGAVRLRPWPFFVFTGLGNLGLALAYATLASCELSGWIAVIAPFAAGLAVPLVVLLVARAFGVPRKRNERVASSKGPR